MLTRFSKIKEPRFCKPVYKKSMNKVYQTKRVIRFRRFCRKAYAAFVSLHREVSVGRVAGYMTDLEMLKQGKAIALVALVFCSLNVAAETDEGAEDSTLQTALATVQETGIDTRQLSLQEVSVVSNKAEVESQAYRLITQVSRAEIEALPIQTVADILQYLPSLDVRTRGANGAQADISMRGGTFDQVLVLINGVSLNDAHTGHYTMNLPLSVSLIERIEVLQGTTPNLYGAFSGAINIITRQPEQNQYTLRLSAGMNGLVNPEFAASWAKGDFSANASVEYSRAEGYYAPTPSDKEQIALNNSDYQLANLFLQTRYKGLDVQLGAQWKDAGAGMYYGFGSQDQFDATRTAFGSAKYSHRWGQWSIDVLASYRANYDRYEWHRGQRLYGNFHFSQNTTAAVAAHYASAIGTTTVGVEVRNENIHSTNLGDTINAGGQVPNVADFPLNEVHVLDLVKGGNRLNINYYAQQTFNYKNLSASLGVTGMYNTQFGHNVSGGANIGYEYAKQSSVYVNAQRSLRLPTFTDLYYNAGNQLGNRDLRPEEAWTLSVGATYNRSFSHAGSLDIAGDWYYRWGRNIIDWVYTAEDTKRPYHAQNQQKVNATGVELTASYSLNQWLRNLSVSYAYTYLDLDLKEAGSRYLDYLSHKLTLRLEHGIYRGFGASWSLRYQQREGQYNDAQGEVQDYKPVWLLDGSIYWQNQYVRVSADCTNMTNRHYYDYGGLLQPGAWAKISIQAHL